MLYVVIAFLCLAILMYLLLGGADFGAGIVELITPGAVREKVRTITYSTIGPIWEANHMWLIIAIVILFVGFPPIYTMLSVHLHIPLVLMLLGIIGRGTAFIFRHYDAVKDDMQRVYNLIFTYSSFITPFFLGVIAGAMVSGQIDPNAPDFYSAYIGSWLHLFSISVGIFTVAICGFLAAVFLIGEVEDEAIKALFIQRAKVLTFLTFISGGLVFLAAEIDGLSLTKERFTDWVSLSFLILATVCLVILWKYLRTGHKTICRLLAGFQITLILGSFGYHYFPDFIIVKSGENLSLFNSAAMGLPIETLGWALLLGSLLILPSLFYLIYSFQRRPAEL
ncbi:cytochrome d ubiquinol oxidase subunit II [Algoriphagus aquimarinus]|uniref:Cytochrome d ubiquinol oxidase subunit II n=1 Tax=Algoriphagus aquimarinus TaxID=237018 RepID=A0A5C7AHQ4_9BACT|nr:cytochrome d ubiquinol oxidase subunit II [Algoriphagus aquimarinus]TXE06963.1 cytochrome d ubiquinol oxidase subunit II [Algoriphagus aquimarinus]